MDSHLINDVNNNIENITNFDVNDLPNSSFNIFLGKRRSGKSVLCEYLIYELIKNKKINIVLLYSNTDAGFEIIKDRECRFQSISSLQTVLDNYFLMNEYNKLQDKKRNKIELSTLIIIDDMAVDLKSKEFEIFEKLATNGRHIAYEPLNLTFCILCQALTKIPRVVRLNADNIFMNAIASETERSMILDENLYLLDGSRAGKNVGRKMYQELVTSEDFLFMCIENWRQNCKCFKDYVKKYKADITKLKM